ncbi:hypothetical protein CBM2599_B30145 [Cupriavidus taiwanensis]|nr:hypothetical protein CBM2599_B30145 [Cupriavidus taiwanensis]SOY98893.1 hypothetical protein CBM2600_B30400 [Cupriavidus taiwanensis]
MQCPSHWTAIGFPSFCSPGHYFNSHCMQTPAGIPGDVNVCEFRRLTGREVVETREKP